MHPYTTKLHRSCYELMKRLVHEIKISRDVTVQLVPLPPPWFLFLNTRICANDL